MPTNKHTEIIVEGRYAALIGATWVDTPVELAPHVYKQEIAADDLARISEIRAALKRGDLSAAAKLAKVYELKPVAAE